MKKLIASAFLVCGCAASHPVVGNGAANNDYVGNLASQTVQLRLHKIVPASIKNNEEIPQDYILQTVEDCVLDTKNVLPSGSLLAGRRYQEGNRASKYVQVYSAKASGEKNWLPAGGTVDLALNEGWIHYLARP